MSYGENERDLSQGFICDCPCHCAVPVKEEGFMCAFCADGDCPDPDLEEDLDGEE